MAGGDVCFNVFQQATEKRTVPTQPDVPAFKLRECCFSLPVFYDNVNPGDIYRNDYHSPIERYSTNYYGAVTIIIQKYESSDWVDKAEITDDTYGTNYPYGTYKSKDETESFVGSKVEWLKVFQAFGEGSYRFRFKEIDFSLNTTDTIYPFEFCLRKYTEERADFTTRFTWNTAGIRGDWQLAEEVWDMTQITDGWDNEIRLPQSVFGYNRSGYEREFIRYQNGQQKWTADKQVEAYTWNSGQYPALLHNYIKTNIFQADSILVTDYNGNNPNIIKDKSIKADSNYEPDWKYNNRRAFVTVDFVEEYQNKIRRRC